MSFQTFLVVSNITIMVGVIITAIGTFGNFYFSKKIEQEKNNSSFAIINHPKKSTKEARLKIDTTKNPVDFSFISTGNNKWFIKDIYIELVHFRREVIVDHKLIMHSCKANMGSFYAMGKYSIKINTNYKYYPLPPLDFSKKEDTWIFQDIDMENISVDIDYNSGIEYIIRLCSNVTNAKSNKEFRICSEEISFYKRKAGKEYVLKFTNWKQPKSKIFGEDIDKNLYKLLVNGSPDFLLSFDKSLVNNKFKKDLLYILRHERKFKLKVEYIIGQLELDDISPYNITLYKILTLRNRDFFGLKHGFTHRSISNKELASKIPKNKITINFKNDMKEILLKNKEGIDGDVIEEIILYHDLFDLYPYVIERRMKSTYKSNNMIDELFEHIKSSSTKISKDSLSNILRSLIKVNHDSIDEKFSRDVEKIIKYLDKLQSSKI